ncbi:MAG: hypothetical protein M2R45_02223 [Verrucomicrobia subdivision 3 bacterium]|nr:hypothetical protein [Limisphaerales bacterium]MCS1413992.1 hypothetical protein [Limisphaerales bacterium]
MWRTRFLLRSQPTGFGYNLAPIRRPVIPCHRTFIRHGQAGIPVSDWFPHVGGAIDDIAVMWYMCCKESNHFPAVIEVATGHRGRLLEDTCLGELDKLCAGNGEPQSVDLCQHRLADVARSIDRRLSRRSVCCDTIPIRGDSIPNLHPPEAVDFSSELGHVKDLHGIDGMETDAFGR